MASAVGVGPTGQEEGIKVDDTQQPAAPFDPHLFFGVTHQPKQVIDDYLASAREGWR